jgi:DNA invertase Pin-like site-specific DNA recombinase
MTVAIYQRVSSKQQDMRSQEADLAAYRASCEAKGEVVETFQDKKTGKHFNREAWDQLWQAVRLGNVNRIVVWRLDRLGRTAGQTIQILDELEANGIGFISLRDGSTPAHQPDD